MLYNLLLPYADLFWTCVLAVVIGLTFSWIVVRTNTPLKGFIAAVSMVPLFVPLFLRELLPVGRSVERRRALAVDGAHDVALTRDPDDGVAVGDDDRPDAVLGQEPHELSHGLVGARGDHRGALAADDVVDAHAQRYP